MALFEKESLRNRASQHLLQTCKPKKPKPPVMTTFIALAFQKSWLKRLRTTIDCTFVHLQNLHCCGHLRADGYKIGLSIKDFVQKVCASSISRPKEDL